MRLLPSVAAAMPRRVAGPPWPSRRRSTAASPVAWAHHRVRLHLLVVLAVDAGAAGDVRGAEQAQEGLAGGHVGQGQRREVDTLGRGGLGGKRARQPVAGRVDEVLDEDVGAWLARVVDADGGVVSD